MSCYEYTTPDDFKAFAVAESIVAGYNLFKGVWLFCTQIPFFKGDSTHPVVFDVFLILFPIFLVAQGIMGFLLFFQGFKKKNKKVCRTWMVAALGNLLILLALNILNVIYTIMDVWPELVSMVYLLYIIVGLRLIPRFLRHLKNEEEGTQPTLTGTEGTRTPSHTQSYVSSRHNQDGGDCQAS